MKNKYHEFLLDILSPMEDRIISLENKISLINKKLFDDEIKDVESIKKETFDFMTAVKFCKEGKHLRSKCWNNGNYKNAVLFYDKESYSIKIKVLDNDYHQNIHVKYEDILATDWEIVE
jgi:hypothetical protein